MFTQVKFPIQKLDILLSPKFTSKEALEIVYRMNREEEMRQAFREESIYENEKENFAESL